MNTSVDKTPLYALANPDAHINVAVIYNPFDRTKRSVAKLVWANDKTVADYMDGAPEGYDWSVGVNGGLIEKSEWSKTRLKPDDWMSVCIVPHGGGGGGGKQVMKLVAIVAIAVIAAYAAPALAGAAMGVESSAIATMGFEGAAIAAGYSSTAATIGLAVAGGVITAVGGMLVSAMMPAPKGGGSDGYDGSLASQSESPSYGVDGAKNTSDEGLPVPVVYGQFRVGGNIVNVKSENVDKTQDLYIQYALSEGEIESISDIELDDQPLSNYSNIETAIRLGTADQAIIDWFDDASSPKNKQVKLTKGTWVTHKTAGEIDKFRIDVSFPAGLCGTDSTSGARYTTSVGLGIEYRKINADGTFGSWSALSVDRTWQSFSGISENATGLKIDMSTSSTPSGNATYFGVHFKAEYRRVGDTDWKIMGETVTNCGYPIEWYSTGEEYWSVAERYTTGSYSASYVVENLEAGPYEVRTSGGSAHMYGYSPAPIVVSDATRNVLRRSFTSQLLEESRYEIRVTRTTDDTDSDLISDDVNLVDINEIVTENIRYRHVATLAMKVRLGEQLSKSPSVTSLVKGRKINQYDENGSVTVNVWSPNPAWIVLDMLTNQRYGAGMPISRFDMPKFVEWAEHCEAGKLFFNGVFDYQTNVWDALQTVCRIGHAQMVVVGTKYSVAIEKADTPVMMFGVGNMVEGSFQINWSKQADRANEIEVNYYDKDDGYRRRTVRVADDTALDRGVPVKSASFTLFGVTNVVQATKEAWFQLALNKYIIQTVQFDTPIEAISCTVGDLVYVQHDMPKWGDAGRLADGSTTTVINLDREVQMIDGRDYRLLVHHDAIKRHEAVVSTKVGNSLFLSGIVDLKPAKRLISGGKDVQINHLIAGSPYTEVVVENAVDINIGATVELWDTDVIEERIVDVVDGVTSTITVTSPFSVTPKHLCNFMFGENTKMKKPFRISSLTGGINEQTRTIKAIEYNESVYEDPQLALPTPNYSALVGNISNVRNISVSDELFISGGVIRTRALIAWQFPENGIYEGADIYLSTNGLPSEFVGRVAGGANSYSFETNDGDNLSIKVVAFDSLGRRASGESVSYTVIGKTAPPSDVTNFVLAKSLGGVEMTWDNVPDIDLLGYEIREGLNWDSGAVIVSKFFGNRFTAKKLDAGTYTYHIRAMDKGLRYSQNVTTATLALPGPSAVSEFVAVQGGGTITFKWKKSSELDVAGYEVKVGNNWSSGVSLFKTDSNAYMVNNGFVGSQTFWIKAYDTSGVYSQTAKFSMLDVAPLDGRNVVVEIDEAATGFTGVAVGLTKVTDGLRLNPSKHYGEYVFPAVFAESVRSRNSLNVGFSVTVASMSWADANFAWNSPSAKQPWVQTGNVETVFMDNYISTYVGLRNIDMEAYALSGDLISVGGITPSYENTIAYAPGRFLQGIVVYDTTEARWDTSVSDTYRVSFWLTPTTDLSSVVFARLKDIGRSIEIGYDDTTKKIYAKDHLDQTVEVFLGRVLNEPTLVSLVQTSSKRKLHVGFAQSKTYVTSSADYNPLGTFSTFEVKQ